MSAPALSSACLLLSFLSQWNTGNQNFYFGRGTSLTVISLTVSQRKFSVTFVLSKLFKFQKEIVKSLLLCFSKIGRILSGTEQRASPLHPKNDLCHDRSLLPCLETPGRRGSSSAICSHAIPSSSPLTPALTREAWPFVAQATGAENEGQASTEREWARRLEKGKEATSEKAELWSGI